MIAEEIVIKKMNSLWKSFHLFQGISRGDFQGTLGIIEH